MSMKYICEGITLVKYNIKSLRCHDLRASNLEYIRLDFKVSHRFTIVIVEYNYSADCIINKQASILKDSA